MGDTAVQNWLRLCVVLRLLVSAQYTTYYQQPYGNYNLGNAAAAGGSAGCPSPAQLRLTGVWPCLVDCQQPSDCSGGYRCCNTGCGRTCIRPVQTVVQQPANPYNYLQNVYTAASQPKPGSCPVLAAGTVGACVRQCTSDAGCQGTGKCCNNGCGMTCQWPVLLPQGSNNAGGPVSSPYTTPTTTTTTKTSTTTTPSSTTTTSSSSTTTTMRTMGSASTNAQTLSTYGPPPLPPFTGAPIVGPMGPFTTRPFAFYSSSSPPPFVTRPTNGPCLQQQAAAGDLTPGKFIPQCTPDGLFAPMQCHGSTGFCWCVDQLRGQEIQGTRQASLRGQGYPDCENIANNNNNNFGNNNNNNNFGNNNNNNFGNNNNNFGNNNNNNNNFGNNNNNNNFGNNNNNFNPTTTTVGFNSNNGAPITGNCLRDRITATSGGAVPPGRFVPNCTPDGRYTMRQCSGSSGHCWCVDMDSGRELPGTRVRGVPQCNGNDRVGPLPPPDADNNRGAFVSSSATRCVAEQQRLQAIARPGSFVPTCTGDGQFTPVQCHASTGYCWCVQPTTGEELLGSRIRGRRPNCPGGQSGAPPSLTPTPNTSSGLAGSCNAEVARITAANGGQLRIGQYIPLCTPDGEYTPVQCHGSTGQCWCVDPLTNQEQPGTRTRPGQPRPNCDANGRLLKDQPFGDGKQWSSEDVRPGRCPNINANAPGACVRQCRADSDCSETAAAKCCSNGCGYTCVPAV